jgi:uncharacterized protein YneF (UPF0154 family)
MEISNIFYDFVFYVVVGLFSGVILGTVFLLQSYTNQTRGRINIGDSGKKKTIAYCFRFGALILSYIVAFSVLMIMKVIKLHNGPILDVLGFLGPAIGGFIFVRKILKSKFCKSPVGCAKQRAAHHSRNKQ